MLEKIWTQSTGAFHRLTRSRHEAGAVESSANGSAPEIIKLKSATERSIGAQRNPIDGRSEAGGVFDSVSGVGSSVEGELKVTTDEGRQQQHGRSFSARIESKGEVEVIPGHVDGLVARIVVIARCEVARESRLPRTWKNSDLFVPGIVRAGTSEVVGAVQAGGRVGARCDR